MREIRRKEYREGREDVVEEILDGVRVGQLGLIDGEGFPLVRPMNFARCGGAVYFHGAREGEKTERLEGPATFSAVDLLSSIPSSWRHPEMACPATTYYRSVMARGRLELVESLDEKAAALQAFMEKYQPEGGYRRITGADPKYRGPLEAILVLKLDVTGASCKVKVGQNLQPDARRRVFARLLERGSALDVETARRMAEVDRSLAEGTLLFPRREGTLVLTDRPGEIPADQLHELMQMMYWAGDRSLDTVRRLVANSTIVLAAIEDGRLLAFARALSDGAARAWIYDVMVQPDRRGAGLGKLVMERLLAHPRLARVQRVTLSTRDAMGLYARYGFEEVGSFRHGHGIATIMVLDRGVRQMRALA